MVPEAVAVGLLPDGEWEKHEEPTVHGGVGPVTREWRPNTGILVVVVPC